MEFDQPMIRTQTRGTCEQEYQIYIDLADDGHGNDENTGQPLKSFDEWMNT